MTDDAATLSGLRQRVAAFVAAREWEPFHTPKNLCVALAVEAAELMEHFTWLDGEQAAEAIQDGDKRAAVADELADVLIYALSLANVLGVDVSEALWHKIERNEERFPVDEWRGKV